MSDQAVLTPFAKMIPRLKNHFGKIPAWSLIYFLNYACFDIQPSPNNYGTPSICPSRFFLLLATLQPSIHICYLPPTYLFIYVLYMKPIADKFHYRQNIHACSECYLKGHHTPCKQQCNCCIYGANIGSGDYEAIHLKSALSKVA